MSEWLVTLIYILGILHAVPAWYFGKAAGIKYAMNAYAQLDNEESA